MTSISQTFAKLNKELDTIYQSRAPLTGLMSLLSTDLPCAKATQIETYLNDKIDRARSTILPYDYSSIEARMSHLLFLKNTITRVTTDLTFEPRLKTSSSKPLSSLEAMRMACFLEIQMTSTKKIAVEFFQRQETKLARNMIINRTERSYTIIPRHNAGRVFSGTYKSVTPDAVTINEMSLTTKKRAVSITKTKVGDYFASSKDLRDTINENDICKLFRGVVGVGQISADTVFQRNTGNEEMPKVSKVAIEAPRGIPGELLYKELEKRSVAEKARFAANITSGLAALHGYRSKLHGDRSKMYPEGIIHDDLKANNFIGTVDEEGIFNGGGAIIDFGLAHPNKGKRQAQKGVGGTAGYTAPELLGDINRTGKDGKPVDIWSCGCGLYTLLVAKNGKEVPWKESIDTFKNGEWEKEQRGGRNKRLSNYDDASQTFTNLEELETVKAKIQKLVNINVEKPITTFEKKIRDGGVLEPTEELHYLVFQMLRLDPAARLSAAELSERFSALSRRA